MQNIFPARIKKLGSKMGKRRRFALILVAAILGFFAFNMIAQYTLAGLQWDGTSDRVHTLSNGSRTTVQNIHENIDVYFYYSRNLDYLAPAYAQFASQIRSMLYQYQNLSDGRIRLHFIDPEIFSEAEDEAIANGLVPVPLYAGTQQAYFGLHVRSGLGNRATIPQFNPIRAESLEYDLTRVFYALLHPQKSKIGVITSLPMDADFFSPLAGNGGAAPWLFWVQLQQSFDVKKLSSTIPAIPTDIDALLILHPKGLSASAKYAIDQFMMRNGRAVILLDPHSEAAAARAMANPDAKPQSSDLQPLLDKWGIAFDPSQTIADRALAQRVVMQDTDSKTPHKTGQDYIAWLRLGRDQANPNDTLSAGVNRLHLATASAVGLKSGSSLTFTPLLRTSDQSMLIPTDKIRFMPDVAKLLADFQPSGQLYILAARIQGPLASAYGKSAPDLSDEEDSDAKLPPHMAQSRQNTQMIVIGDSDLAEDRMWADIPKTLQAGYVVEVAENAGFILNALDQVLGADVFTQIRTRAGSQRSLYYLHRLRQAAEDQYLRRRQELQQNLQQAEAKLKELQAAKDPSKQQQMQQTADQVRQDMVQTRADLRQVQYALNRDIQGLQNTIRLLLIVVWPLLLAALHIGLVRYWMRRKPRW